MESQSNNHCAGFLASNSNAADDEKKLGVVDNNDQLEQNSESLFHNMPTEESADSVHSNSQDDCKRSDVDEDVKPLSDAMDCTDVVTKSNNFSEVSEDNIDEQPTTVQDKSDGNNSPSNDLTSVNTDSSVNCEGSFMTVNQVRSNSVNLLTEKHVNHSSTENSSGSDDTIKVTVNDTMLMEDSIENLNCSEAKSSEKASVEQDKSKDITKGDSGNNSSLMDVGSSDSSQHETGEVICQSPGDSEDNVGMDLSMKTVLFRSEKSSTIENKSFTGLEKGESDKEVTASGTVTPGGSGSNEDESIDNLDVSSHSKDDIPELNNEEIGFPEEFQGHVVVGRYISVKGDFTLRSSEALVESPSLVAPFLLKEPDVFPPREQPLKQDKMFFRSSIGEFLVSLGLSRAKEVYQRDIIRIKNKQLNKDMPKAGLEEELKYYQSNYVQTKMANEPFTFTSKRCSNCNFASESDLVLEGHKLTPHITPRKEYQCSYCPHIDKDSKSILRHMRDEHNKIGYLLPNPILHECTNCIFECSSKQKFSSHTLRCLKYFDSSVNQAPLRDFEFPCLTPKPITVAVVKAYEKSLTSMHSRYRKPKKNMDFSKGGSSHDGEMLPEFGNSAHKGTRYTRPLSLNPLTYPNSSKLSQFGHTTSGLMPQGPAITNLVQFPFPVQRNRNTPSFKGTLPPGLPQPPKLQGPYPVQMDTYLPPSNSSATPNSLVVCEICDGYIKDMEQLRTHMQLIHKVKIHPKVLSSRPPLNCQKCQWRFFTDQGLERHLLGAHGLVTSNMQEMANKSKDAGCCTICGRVFASKLVTHMNQVHKVTLKPAHLSYKCTVCSATFNLYRLFENHVYLVHSGATKRLSEGNDLQSSKRMASMSNWDGVQSASKEKRLRNLAEKENGAT